MNIQDRQPNYDKYPTIKVKGYEQEVFTGYQAIAEEIKKQPKAKQIVVDCYPGMNDEEVLGQLITELNIDTVVRGEDIFYDGDTLTQMMKAHLTDDRVRGVMYDGKITDFVDPDALQKMQEKAHQASGNTLIYGVGASLITKGDVLIYADLARWEIQLRYRKGMPNFKQNNHNEDILRKYKRGFFIEWRIADKHKRALYNCADYWLDTNKEQEPKMLSGDAFRAGLKQTVTQPFRTVPYFDPGVWGGQWMKKVCGLDEKEENFAWSFDGVPEENSLLLQYGEVVVEVPSINAVLYQPEALLGQQVYARFGAEFPIRFDLLDTMGGQNLSLQVHPTMDFIQQEYGMPYTQEESYYMLDADPGAQVYLGVKNGIDQEAFVSDLEKAAAGQFSFPAEKYVNLIETKPHDHFLIPPGTIHCSATGCMVLEISASAYIFTFKLWDWNRLGLDHVPRPIHLEEGKKVMNYDYDTDFTMNELVNQFEILEEEPGYLKEKTGLHELEFIQTNRYTISKKSQHETAGTVHMLNLVDGEEMLVESPSQAFEPFVVHYAETFIIPASIGQYTMAPFGLSEGKEIKILQANVRSMNR